MAPTDGTADRASRLNETAGPGVGPAAHSFPTACHWQGDSRKVARATLFCKREGGQQEAPPSVFIAKTLPTAYGHRLAAPPRPLLIPRSAEAAAAFAAKTNLAADEAFAAGRFAAADRLASAVYEARRRAAEEAR